MLAAKAPQKEIAQAASCSLSQIKRMAKNIRKYGKPVAPKIKPQGRPRVLADNVVEVLPLLTKADSKGLLEHFREHPSAHLADLVGFISDTYQVSTTKSTISRVLKRANVERVIVRIPMEYIDISGKSK